MRRQVEVSKPKPKPKPFYQRKTKTMKLEVVATPPVGRHRRLANGSSSAGIAPATNSVINCPGATATGGYRYPIPTIVFTDALWPNAPEETAAHKIANVIKRFITLS